MDLNTSGVGFKSHSATDANGRIVVHVKRGDKFPVALSFMKEGEIIDLPVTAIAMVCKEFEPDTKIILTPDEYLVKEGSGNTARWLVLLDLTDTTLSALLSGYEEDQGTALQALCEFEVTFDSDLGDEEPVESVRSSATFTLVIHRDLQR